MTRLSPRFAKRSMLVAGALALVATLSATATPPPLAASFTPMGADTFEPTLGVAPDGAIYYSMTPVSGVAIGFGTGVWRSDDGGATWTDVSPKIAGVRMPPETNDPYVYVDDQTGRVFQFAMAPILTCTIASHSDDRGASWMTNARGCGDAPPYDHQTMVAAKSRTGLPTVGYPSILHQCVNAVWGATCSRSLNGGLSWEHSGVAYLNTPITTVATEGRAAYGAQHGHLAAAPDGTLYLPTHFAVTTPHVAISRDDGTTWELVQVSDKASAFIDPAVAVDTAGNAYFVFTDPEGRAWLSVSTDAGRTWSDETLVTPPGVTSNLATIAAGAPGAIAIAYAGTDDLANGFKTTGYPSNTTLMRNVRWDAYLAVSVDALSGAPTIETTIANPATDPIVRGACGPGRCPGLVDFIDVQIGGDGRPYAAFVDACQTTCVTSVSGGNRHSEAVLVTMTSGPSLR